MRELSEDRDVRASVRPPPPSPPPPSPSARTSFTYQHRRLLLIVFAVLFIAAGWYGRDTAGDLVAGGFDDPRSESSRADALLDQRFGFGTPDVVVAYTHPSLRVDDPRFEQLLAPALRRISLVPGVDGVATPYGAQPDALVSKDGRTVVSTVRLAGTGKTLQSAFDAVEPQLQVPGLTALVGGAVPGSRQAQEAAERDLIRAELITLPLLAILLVIFFRGLVVASLPLLVGGFSVACALACVRLMTHFSDVSIFAMNIVTFVGLGVAIDYSLFMTSRFRDELGSGLPVEKAVFNTMKTAGRTIAYSGLAVGVSLLALMVFPLMLLRSVAVAGSLVIVMSLLGALLFLPAMLAALGPRIELLSFGAKREVATTPRFWSRVATLVMRAPVLVTVLVTCLLVALGLPFLRINAAVSGAAVLPADAQARQVAELLESPAFPTQAVSPIQIVVTTPSEVLSAQALDALERYVKQIERVPHVSHVDGVVGSGGPSSAQLLGSLQTPAAPAIRARLSRLVQGRETALRVSLDVPPASAAAIETLKQVRALEEPSLKTLVTSPAARLVDLQATLNDKLPWALGLICLATFVVLFLAFGSVVMPIKAILMNILSLTASFGALVWIFQDGRFESFLGYRSPGNIELTIPVVMFAVVFGLAMDYELFLLSRIREAYDRTGDTHASVTTGLEQTGQIITRAALLLVAVMIGFISADMLLVKELGVGMAVAIIVDATIVRALLVPATMQLLGHYNWWAPKPLAQLWARLSLGVDERS